MGRKIAFLLIIFLASACTMPETRIFNLAMPALNERTSAKAANEARLCIIVDAPRHLSQPYIVYRNSPYQLSLSRYARWDAAPAEMLREAARNALLSSGMFRDISTGPIVPSGAFSLRIVLKQFERFDAGESSYGTIAFEAALFSPSGAELYRDTLIKKIKLEDRTFLSLAKGLSPALAESVSEMKAGMTASPAK